MEGDKESNGLIENTVMLIRGIIRTIKCHIENRTQERLHGKKPSQQIAAFGAKVVGKQISADPIEQNESPETSSGFGLEVYSEVVKSED